MLVATYIGLFSSLLNFVFTKQWNLQFGISNFWFLVIMDCILGTISDSLFFIPLMSFFAQVTPKNIEGTIFALMTGVTNLSFLVVSPLIGNWINDYWFKTPITKDNLEDMW